MKSIELKRQFAAVYPLIKQLMANRPYFADFTEVMDVEAPVYVDFCHVSPEGNERAADAMAHLIDPHRT